MTNAHTVTDRLEMRVRDLEEDLRRERMMRRDEDAQDVTSDYQDVAERAVDESARVLRALILATLEGCRAVADSAGYFVEDVLDRNVPARDESASDTARRLPGDLSHGIVRALDRALDEPQRVVERFDRTYSDEGGQGRRWRVTRPNRRTHPVEHRPMRVGAPPPGEGQFERHAYEERSKSALYERARQLDVGGRSQMSKQELIDAVRTAEQPYNDPSYESWSRTALEDRAEELSIENLKDMSRGELIDSIREHESPTGDTGS